MRHWQRLKTMDDYNELIELMLEGQNLALKEIIKLESKIEILTKALEFYKCKEGNDCIWLPYSSEDKGMNKCIDMDDVSYVFRTNKTGREINYFVGGSTARKALAEIENNE